MSLKLKDFDVADFLDIQEDAIAYLEAVLEDGELPEICAALGDIARSRGMTEIAKATGLSRESLYKALGENGNPSFSTVRAVLGAMGLRLSVAPVRAPAVNSANQLAVGI